MSLFILTEYVLNFKQQDPTKTNLNQEQIKHKKKKEKLIQQANPTRVQKMERLKHGLTQGEAEGDKEYLYKRGTIRAGQALTQVENHKRRENHEGKREAEHGRRDC